MKKAFFFLLLMAATTLCFAQQESTVVPPTQTDFLRKSKNQKTAACVLLGIGTVVSMTGIAKVASNTNLNPFNGEPIYKENSGDILLLIGTCAMLGSIPLFIAASKTKRKAISLAFKNEYSEQIRQGSAVHKVVPSLSLKIGL